MAAAVKSEDLILAADKVEPASHHHLLVWLEPPPFYIWTSVKLIGGSDDTFIFECVKLIEGSDEFGPRTKDEELITLRCGGNLDMYFCLSLYFKILSNSFRWL